MPRGTYETHRARRRRPRRDRPLRRRRLSRIEQRSTSCTIRSFSPARATRSRLIVGTGKYRDFEETRQAVELSGAEIVTVAVRRVNITDPKAQNLLDHLDPARYTILPNTAGCYTADDAVRTCRLARDAGVGTLVKLEVIGDERTLFPDVPATLEAAQACWSPKASRCCPTSPTIRSPASGSRRSAAPRSCRSPRRSAPGSASAIPTTSASSSSTRKVPVIVDAGVGTASDAALALELGCDAVLMNTAIAGADDPLLMAEAMRLGVEAGRKAFQAGRIARKLYATASSPLGGLIE